MKTCKTCGELKPLDQFHKDRAKADGLNLYCKTCTIAKVKANLAKPPRRVDPPGLKTCQRCKEVKPVAEYYALVGTWDGLGKVCKACSAARHDAWRRKNLGKVAADARRHRAENPERHADYDRKKNYGLPAGEYDRMLTAQGGLCAICRTDTPGGRGAFHVDHCHETQVIRGLLCHKCNLGIGQLRHDPRLLQSAIEYLTTQR